MNMIIKLAISDFKIIFRDPSLKAFLFLPIVLFAVFLWFLPLMAEKYEFLIPYLPIFIVVGVIENTQAFCFINSMVLLDEKETGVAKTYGIVPISKFVYIFSRFLIPFIITVCLNIIFLEFQPFYEVNFIANIIISIVSGLIVPVYALSINSIATNRMQGMIYVKAFNMLVLIPIAAFFVPEKIKYLFGVLPTHWIFQSINNISNGEIIGYTASIGFVYLIILGFFISKKFSQKHFLY